MALVDPLIQGIAEQAGTQEPGYAAPTIEDLLKVLAERRPDEDTSEVRRAFDLAQRAHAGQYRLSGEPYVTHSVAVAIIVAELGLDATSAIAALLHDVVEDTEVSLEEVESMFGSEVATIVDGVTKLDRLHFSSKEAQQAATVRKMLVAMAKDWRVLVIKLADRLHNMRTLSVMPDWKQRRTAQQTLDIFAPLAHRLGIQEIKWQLEDLAFEALHPKRYAEIAQMIATRAPRRATELTEIVEGLRERLGALGIEATVTGRPKHLWSIYEKMVVRGKEFDEIYDLLGIRIVVESEKDCWAALGSVHAMWAPVPGRFKDYINSPKFNLYQSLHTTVVASHGKPLEIQIRTQEMHRRAEYGIAAHWGYKEDTSHNTGGARSADDIAWLQRIVDWERDTPDPIEFLETLKLDLEQDEVYVFTPKGAIVTLPAGATPIDFAYAIHTEVGHRCIGARVNGRLAPLDIKMSSGDTVEIFTSKVAQAAPSQDWLKIVVSPRARNKIRQWFSRERREDAIESGKDELVKALRREGLSVQRTTTSPELVELATEMGYADLDALYAAIGEGHCSSRGVVQRLHREALGPGDDVQLPTTVFQQRRPSARRSGTVGVYVEGLDDVMVRLSRCCTPVPGDPIIGFVTRGRGVTVHRENCTNALTLAGSHRERLIDVEWEDSSKGVFVAGIEVKGLDRAQLLADVARVLAEHHVGIVSSSSQVTADRVARMRFECELADAAHLDSVIFSLRHLEGVYDAYRLLPGRGAPARTATR